jgi:hypothetical protein
MILQIENERVRPATVKSTKSAPMAESECSESESDTTRGSTLK